MPAKIELHYGPDFCRMANSFISEHPDVLSGDGSSLYLSPNAERAEFLKQQYLLGESGSLSTAFPFHTVSGFFQMLLEKLDIPAQLLSYGQRAIVLHDVISLQRGNLKYFTFPEQTFSTGMVKSLLQFFDEVRLDAAENTLLPEGKNRLAPNAGDLLKSDLSLLFNAYRERLRQGYLDEAELLQRIPDKLSPEFLHNFFPNLKTIVWENVDFFRERHLVLVRKLADLGITNYLLLGYGNNPEIFSIKNELFTKLKAVSETLHEHLDSEAISGSLFQLYQDQPVIEKNFSILPAVDRLREVENLVGQIKRLVVDEELEYRQIVVTSPAPASYRALLETVLHRYRIPFTSLESERLDQSLPVQHFLVFARLAQEDFPLSLVQKILQSPFFHYRRTVQSTRYKKILSGMRVRSGARTIIDYLKKEQAFYAQQAGEDEPASDAIEDYRRLIAALEELFRDAEFFSKSHTAPEIYGFVADFFMRHETAKNLIREARAGGEAPAERNLAGLRQFMEILFFWQAAASDLAPDQKIAPDDFLQKLVLLTETTTFHLRRPRSVGVQIIPFREVSEQEFTAVFVLGMEDQVIPARQESFFANPQTLDGRLRAFVPPDSLQRDRETFLRILQMPTRCVQFSYPRFHQDNPVLPSIFLRELERISVSSLQKEKQVELFTPADVLARISPAVANREEDLRWDTLPENIRSQLDAAFFDSFIFHHRVEKMRRDASAPTAWEGELQNDSLSALWLEEYYRQKSFSITQLEAYAKCPMIFFFQRILGTEPLEEAEEFLSPLDRGLLIHEILFRFYRENPPTRRTVQRLRQIAEQEWRKIPVPRSILFVLEKEFYLGGPGAKGLLEIFWEYEQEIAADYATQPLHFELSFGNRREQPEQTDPASTEESVAWKAGDEEFRFRGKIDRVEISPEGVLLVVDYKTGHTPVLNEMWEGMRLQLPIYLKAALDLLRDQYENLEPAGGVYYELRKATEINKRMVFMDSNAAIGTMRVGKSALLPNDKYVLEKGPASLQDFIQHTFEFAVQYIRGIRAGHFPHTTDESRCKSWNKKNCQFLPLCRVNWQKQKKLRGAER